MSVKAIQTREEYLLGLIPAGLDYDKKYWKNFEKYSGYKGNGVYHWKEVYSNDTRLLYLMGVLKSENIDYDEE